LKTELDLQNFTGARMDYNEFSETPGSSNPFGTQPIPASGPMQSSSPSMLGVFSMIAGIVSPMLCCLCYLSLFSSVTAIITGHLSLAEINRSQGRVSGRPLAIIGLAIGYPMLLLTLLMIGFGVYSNMNDQGEVTETETPSLSTASGEQALRNAEMKILSDSQDGVYGNTAKAKALAKAFSEEMKILREALFTEDDRKLQITGGNFVTFCELHEDRALFLVHVPAYRDFEQEAKDDLADLAWMTAQTVVEGTLQERDRLAVGMKGTLLYGSVMVGYVGAEDPNSTGTDKDVLADFFPAQYEFEFNAPVPAEVSPDEPSSTADDF
jgi:Domain of unknown function (DUF4190)